MGGVSGKEFTAHTYPLVPLIPIAKTKVGHTHEEVRGSALHHSSRHIREIRMNLKTSLNGLPTPCIKKGQQREYRTSHLTQ